MGKGTEGVLGKGGLDLAVVVHVRSCYACVLQYVCVLLVLN